MIKTGPLIPGIGKKNLDSPPQGSKPVTLTSSSDAHKPPVKPGFGDDTRPNDSNRSLKTLKISRGSQSYDTSAIRTPESL
jgi:hypothetical protein